MTLLFAVATMSAMAAGNKNDSTVVFTTTPQMHCSSCEAKIKDNLRFERGVRAIKTSVPDQTVTVTYDARKTDKARLAKGFSKFGYTARELKKGEKVKFDPEAAGASCASMGMM